MRESRFLCLAVSRRNGGNCIAGIDIDSGKWVRPINAKTHGAFGDFEVFALEGATQKREILAPLDVVQLHLDRFAGSNIQPENWEVAPATFDDPYPLIKRFGGQEDADMLHSFLDDGGPLLYSISNRISADDPLLLRGLGHSLSLIEPDQLYWRVGPHPSYPSRLRVEADFHFGSETYCLIVTDPIWETRCRRFGSGRHAHAQIAGDMTGLTLLAISLAELPLHGFHYKLVAGVILLPL